MTALPESSPPPHVGSLHRIPSLDGLRAVSILMVLTGHATIPFQQKGALSNYVLTVFGNGELGVLIFFVISGFLITTLLLNEKERTGTIRLGQFYLRRAFRIWPAFYTFLGVVLVLWGLGAISLTGREFVCAALFLQNYSVFFVPHAGQDNLFIGHIWTLSVEEQFYVLWPLSLLWLKPRQAITVACALIALLPVVRVVEYFLLPTTRDQIPIMLHTRADSLMFGCAAALLYQNAKFQQVMQRLFRARVPLLAALFMFFVSPYLMLRLRGMYGLPIGWTLEGASACLIMLWVIQHPHSWIGVFLNSKVMAHIGVISYSLYLWQQLFTVPPNRTFTGHFPLNILLAVLVAEVSYFLIERPALDLRRRLSAKNRPSPSIV